MRFVGILAIGVCMVLIGCRSYEEPAIRDYFEGDHVSNYRRVFQVSPPEDVDVVNSIVIAYGAGRDVMTRDDWAFELIVTREWIDKIRQRMLLARAEEVSHAVSAINERKGYPLRPWYAPKPVSEYELYYLTVTPVPYIQMLVDVEPEPDGRYRVFISKH